MPKRRYEYEVSPQDYPNRIVVSASYELPFGRDKYFGRHAGAVLDRIIGGWVVNSISTYQSGPPVAWGNVIYFGGPLNWNPGNTQQAFNTAAFDRNSADTLADNVGLSEYFSNLRSASYSNEDFSAIKNTRLTERLSFQLRFEFFNLFNTPTYAAPNLTPTSTAFGAITADQTKQNMREIQMAAYIRW